MTGRAEFDLKDVPVGTVVRAPDRGAIGREWIFIGWQRNTVGHEMLFVRAVLPNDRNNIPYLYHASMTETILRNFPDLAEWRRK